MHGDIPALDSIDGDCPRDAQITYSPRSAARVLDVSERQMWSLLTAGDIESIKIGRLRRIPRSALIAFVESRPRVPAA